MENLPKRIRKRDGSTEELVPEKIEKAIYAAASEALESGERAAELAEQCTGEVLERAARSFEEEVPDVEDVQDLVEEVLMDAGHYPVARAYIIYRSERSRLRQTKDAFEVTDDMKLPLNALLVMKERYLLRNDRREVVETPGELFGRVARSVAEAEERFDSGPDREEVEEEFYRMMTSLEFLPNSPTLMNAGTDLGQLSACFVLPVEDSMDRIFASLGNMARIHQTGGGTGFDFSQLRPEGDLVSSTKGKASGPVSFMSVFDGATGVIVQGGRRRGANMGVLRCDHPDIRKFVEAKLDHGTFSNFNLSVGVTDEFMRAVRTDSDFDLVNPRTSETVSTVSAKALFDLIVFTAWRTGDPGLVFLDEINRHNPTPGLGRMAATNPCGEVPLLPWESCNLGSVNLSRFVRDGRLRREALRHAVRTGVRFLDDVIEVNRFPLPETREATLANRKIGLGVMGFADLLIELGIPYGSREAVQTAADLMEMIHRESMDASRGLAGERGAFPNFEKSVHRHDSDPVRNATVNTIAPTGTISMIAGCSSGIEPVFSLVYNRNVLGGRSLEEVHPILERKLRRRGLYSRELMGRIAREGSVREMEEIPDDMREVFETAFDVSPQRHLRVQAAFQRYTDNSVSKTVNLPHEASVEDVRGVYLSAHELSCKGITVYRYGTSDDQVLTLDDDRDGGGAAADAEYSGGCASGTCEF